MNFQITRALALLFWCSAGFGAEITNRIVSPEIHADQRVTFRLEAPKAEEAALFGDWMEVGTTIKMSRGLDGRWTVTVGPMAPGLYIYHFAVDGMVIADPVNPQVKLRARTSASLLEVPGKAPEIWEARAVPHGTIEIVPHVASALGGQTRQAWVYKPPGYDRSASTRYPVLYLLHGSNDTPAGWTMAGRANFILDNLIAGKKAREMIVVMPFGHAAPFTAPREQQTNNTALFEAYLLNDLAPLIESKYRVAKGRENRAIVGLSMGGAQALQIGFAHLENFSAIGAFSSGPPPDFQTRFDAALANPEATNKKLDLLWLGCGRQDTGAFKRTEELSALLSRKGIRHTFHPTEGQHTFTVWREYLAEIAPALFKKPKN